MDPITARKTEARKAGLEGRPESGPQAQAAQRAIAVHLADALAPHRGRTLAGYMAMRAEADPMPAMQTASLHGEVCVPVIIARGVPLKFRAWHPDSEMEDGPFGAKIPVAGAWLRPRVVIVPLVAFDARGVRLGYGGGFYDRTLAQLRTEGPVTAIGLAFDGQELGAVPREATDEPLDMIVTQSGIRTFGA